MQETKNINNYNFPYKRGELLSGTVSRISVEGADVNLGALLCGFVPKQDINSVFKVGDTILVLVTKNITEDGRLVLDNKTALEMVIKYPTLSTLKAGQIITGLFDNIGKSGLSGKYEQFQLFLPFSQLGAAIEGANLLLNKEIKIVVLQVNYYNKTIIVSSSLIK